MGIDVHVLGTASARPTNRRDVSGSAVKCHDGIAVIDCGEGFQNRFSHQRKMLKQHEKGTTLKPKNVDVLLFTHGHLDHTWGALPWMQTMSLDNRETPLLVLGPSTGPVLDALLSGSELPKDTPPSELARQWRSWHSLGANDSGLTFPTRWVLGDMKENRWVELNAQTGKAVALDSMPQPIGWSSCKIEALQTHHSVPSCAWAIKQVGKRGKFDRLRAAELRLTEEQRMSLARGDDVTLENGDILDANSFRGKSGSGLSVILSGDTAEGAPGLLRTATPTLLVHEATFLESQSDKAAEHLHSTVAGAVRTAQQMKVNHLALTHYSSRIKDLETVSNEVEVGDAHLDVVCLNDGDRLRVGEDGSVSHLVFGQEGWSKRNMSPNR
jgi:ribonuclease Z